MRFASSVFTLLLLAACAEPDVETARSAEPLVAEAERDVYVAALTSIAADTFLPAFPVMLGESTAMRLAESDIEGSIPVGLARDVPSLLEETWADFALQNGETAKFTEPLPVPAVLGLVSEASFISTFSAGVSEGWEAFRSQHPGAVGLAVVSRVGFSPDAGEALVFVSLNCGGHCGYGQYVLLRRAGARWSVIGTSVTWIA